MFASGSPRTALVSRSIATVGLLAVAAGGFLPWMRSGAALRSSFEAAGVLGRWGPSDLLALDVILAGWLTIPLLCVICAGLHVVGALRTAAGLTIIVSVLAGTVALATYVLGPSGSGAVAVVAAGPLTTCFGAALALAGSLGALLGRRIRQSSGSA